MRHFICLMVSIYLLPMSAWGAGKAAVVSAKKSTATMQVNLLKRCNDGVAVACFDYGKSLLQSRKKTDVKRGKIYVRRACTLAYAPACQQSSSSDVAKVVKDEKPRLDANGKPCNAQELAKSARISDDGRKVADVDKDSLWDQAGFKSGDTLVSVNGKPFEGADQIASALEKGGAVINVLRNGSETSLMISCP